MFDEVFDFELFKKLEFEIIKELELNNEDYTRLCKIRHKLSKDHPEIEHFLYNPEAQLNPKQHRVYIEYLGINHLCECMERHAIYVQGHCDAMAYFKKLIEMKSM